MTAASRLLSIVKSTGPRKRRILENAIGHAESAFRALLQDGRLVAINSKRGTLYGTPAQRSRFLNKTR